MNKTMHEEAINKQETSSVNSDLKYVQYEINKKRETFIYPGFISASKTQNQSPSKTGYIGFDDGPSGGGGGGGGGH